MRKFEKISYEQFSKDIIADQNVYNNYELPTRATSHSAGYDIRSVVNFVIHPGEIKKIPTGLKANMNEDEVLMLFIRSSIGLKYQVRLLNSVGIIDSDYYNNPSNEGHFFVTLKNDGKKDFIIKAGDRFGQGIFIKYLTVNDEQEINKKRSGGFGSTNKEEE